MASISAGTLIGAALAVPLAAVPLASQAPRTPYWQQRVEYRIQARLNETAGVLSGTQRIVYRNESPDTLTTFSLHLYLNAFRPGSRWSAADSVEGRRRFNDLAEPDFAFNHVRRVRIMGRPATAQYPFAPDSTIVRFDLPRPLGPGDTLVATMEWDARPSTTPRRQGRRERAFDFAQWYPRVVAYDRHGWNEHPLYPAGEFYGEFGSFLVDLNVRDDQVIGATGVPLCGDPGWAHASRGRAPIDYRRTFYGATVGGIPVGDHCPQATAAGPGRKRVVWYADDVHHFAMSLNPDYRYEGGRMGNVSVHVLYQPGDEDSWGGGVAVARTEKALAWLDGLFGPFPWPQLTNVHRIEGGGTEFPMMVMDGSPSQGLIVHEGGHNYVMGVLANNEWREGFLDEGFTSFQTSWFWEHEGRPSAYPGVERTILDLDLDGYSQPVSLVSEDYRDFFTYVRMIYTKGQLFYYQLRYLVGDDVMREILHVYYDRWKLKHVDEDKFREVAEEVSGRDLSGFFAQWLHAVVRYDYGVGRLQRLQLPDGRWRSRVEIRRHEHGRMPVDVAVYTAGDTVVRRIEGLADREWLEVVTPDRPLGVRLDPGMRSHDWNMLNNERSFGKVLGLIRRPAHGPAPHFYPDTYLTRQTRRDRTTVGAAPTFWYNEAGGITLGLRLRSNYLDRYNQNQLLVSQATGWGLDNGETETDFFFRLVNPVFLRSHSAAPVLEAFRTEGRFGGRLGITRTHRDHPTFGPTRRSALWLEWVQPDNFRYLDRGYYEDAGTVELRGELGLSTDVHGWSVGLATTVAGGLAYNRDGLAQAGRAVDPFYFRGTLAGTARREVAHRLQIGLRGYAGLATGTHDAAKQRQIYFQGADPLRQLNNPFLRSRGALLVGSDMFYQMPGGAGVRGVDPRLSTVALVGLNLELERALRVTRSPLFNRITVALFGDFSQAIGDRAAGGGRGKIDFLADAGVGVRARHRLGQSTFWTRFDFPLWISSPEFAHDPDTRTNAWDFRWTVSFDAPF